MQEILTKSWADEGSEESGGGGGGGTSYTFLDVDRMSGKEVRGTRTVRNTKTLRSVPKRVEQRRRGWKKFGRVAGVEGLEPGATYQGEEVYLIFRSEKQLEKEYLEKEAIEREVEQLYKQLMTGMAAPEKYSAGGGGGINAPWRPKSRTNISTTEVTRTPPIIPTLRVTNLSEETTENDLAEIFRDYAPTKIRLLRDRETQLSRGFAFINFSSQESARIAMEARDAFRWDHLILSVEWAK